jgi:DNA-binding NarL/FixJ family response regulator
MVDGSAPPTVIRVLVADDQELYRRGVEVVLSTEDDIQMVAEASDGAEAVTRAEESAPDVILMDIRMPKLDGIEATRRILTDPSCEGTRIIVLTTFDIDEYVYAALQAGASGFLLKDSTPEAIVEAVRVVAAGDALLAPSVTRRFIERFARGRGGEPDEHAQRRGLAGAVRSQKTRHPSAGGDEGQVVDDALVAVLLTEVPHLYRWGSTGIDGHALTMRSRAPPVVGLAVQPVSPVRCTGPDQSRLVGDGH